MVSHHNPTTYAPTGDRNTYPADRQRSARTDPSMRDGDSGRGNPYEDAPEEFRTDDDVGDVIAYTEDSADEVPLDDDRPAGQAGRSHQLPASESAVVPTADQTATGADRGGPDAVTADADDATAVAEEATGTRNHAAAAVVGREDRSDENDHAVRGEPVVRRRPSADRRNKPADPGLPIEGYRDLTVPQILQRVFEMPIDGARAVQGYERSHLRRKTLLVKLERYLRGK